MTMLARIEATDMPDRRRARRHVLNINPTAVVGREGVDVLVHDLSLGGLLIESSAELPVGEQLTVELPEAGAVAASVVWSTGRYCGCRFDQPLTSASLAAARLRNPDQGRPMFAPIEAIEPAAPSLGKRLVGRHWRLVGALAIVAWAIVLIPIALF